LLFIGYPQFNYHGGIGLLPDGKKYRVSLRELLYRLEGIDFCVARKRSYQDSREYNIELGVYNEKNVDTTNNVTKDIPDRLENIECPAGVYTKKLLGGLLHSKIIEDQVAQAGVVSAKTIAKMASDFV
jgi:hypothetical protein